MIDVTLPSTNIVKRFYHPRLKLLATALLFTACASQQHEPPGLKEVETSNVPLHAAPERVPDLSFETDTLYSLLVAEIALNRQRYDIALQNYAQQAKTTKNLDIVTRASHIAQVLRAREESLDLASLWLSIEPENLSTKQVLASELMHTNRLEEALDIATQLLKSGESAPFDSIAAKYITRDKAQVVATESLYNNLRSAHPETDTLALGHSFLLQKLERFEEALAAVDKADQLNPNQVQIQLQRIRIFEQMQRNDEALALLAALADQHPNNVAVRARYARKLANKDIHASLAEFESVYSLAPNNPNLLYSLALVSKEAKQYEKAIGFFTTLLDSLQHKTAAHVHLAQIHESQKNFQAAIEHLKAIPRGQDYIKATSSIVRLLAKQNANEEAIQFIQTRVESARDEEQAALAFIHGDLLSRSGQISAAEKVFTHALNHAPEDPRLLYARAIVLTQINHIDAAILDLEKLVQLYPKNAVALNALGYTLVDRTDRKQEAFDFIQRAYKLNPKDPAILDSMGWAHYHLGNADKAMSFLKKAMDAHPDHEIAAHLGEVLWQSGFQDEARIVWQRGFKLKPESEVIHRTLHRLNATLETLQNN